MGIWKPIRDGDPRGLAIFKDHYSYRPYKDGRQPKLFVGPGFKTVLISEDERSLFVWRKFRSMDNQEGVNCAVFRNNGSGVASEMIREAMAIAWNRWPGERLYTYVNARKIASSNPGYCFKRAGWVPCGVTKSNKLIILEVRPNVV